MSEISDATLEAIASYHYGSENEPGAEARRCARAALDARRERDALSDDMETLKEVLSADREHSVIDQARDLVAERSNLITLCNGISRERDEARADLRRAQAVLRWAANEVGYGARQTFACNTMQAAAEGRWDDVPAEAKGE